MKFTIYGKLPSLNEYINACRTNVFKANKMKQTSDNTVILSARRDGLTRIDKYPIKVKVTFYESNSKRDVDNVAFANKFILDGLVKAHIIEDDSQKYVKEIHSTVKVDKANPRVEVVLIQPEQPEQV